MFYQNESGNNINFFTKWLKVFIHLKLISDNIYRYGHIGLDLQGCEYLLETWCLKRTIAALAADWKYIFWIKSWLNIIYLERSYAKKTDIFLPVSFT